MQGLENSTQLIWSSGVHNFWEFSQTLLPPPNKTPVFFRYMGNYYKNHYACKVCSLLPAFEAWYYDCSDYGIDTEDEENDEDDFDDADDDDRDEDEEEGEVGSDEGNTAIERSSDPLRGIGRRIGRTARRIIRGIPRTVRRIGRKVRGVGRTVRRIGRRIGRVFRG